MEPFKAGKTTTEYFVNVLWKERYPWPIPESFVRYWVGRPSHLVISAMNEGRMFYRRFPDKEAMDIARLISSYITKGLKLRTQ